MGLTPTERTGPLTTAAEVRRIYVEKAVASGIVLDDDDFVVLEQCCAVASILEALDADISKNGVTTVTAAGTVKVSVAVVESRQQRIALTRLMAVLDQRISAVTGAPRAPGGQPGVRGLHNGTGAQNQQRDAERATRKRGQHARPTKRSV